MAWNYPEGYPQNREEALALMMTIRKEDIDYSDIPPIRIPEGAKIRRLGELRRERGRKNNFDAINKILREYDEMKETLARLQQSNPELFKENN